MSRSRDYNRTISFTKALRKRQIDRDRFPPSLYSFGDWYNNLHQFSKNKIHCSCPMCAAKTNSKRRKNNWKISDQRDLDEMSSQLKEFDFIKKI